jgi:replicative DNA helicase
MSVADVVPMNGGGGHVDIDRTPPQDIVAEQCVLGGMLLSKDAIADVVEVLRPTDFYRPVHQTVYDAIIDLYGKGEPADPVTIAAELTRLGHLERIGGGPYLHTLVASVPTAANAGYYAEIVRERAILRRLVEAGTKVVQLGYGAASAGGMGGDVNDVVDRAQAAVYEVVERRTSEDYIGLEAAMWQTYNEIEQIGNRGGELFGVPTGFRDLDELTNGLHVGQLIVVAGRPGLGKALALNTRLATPTGWTTMGVVQVGDQLLGADGKPTTVTAATEVLSGRPCYEVQFDDGSAIVADELHQWLTQTRRSRRAAQAAGVPAATGSEVRTTREIAQTLQCKTTDGRLNHAVAVASPLNLPDAELLIAPYLLGVWLGDGHSAGARLTTADPEIPMYIEAAGYRVDKTSGRYLYSVRLPERPAVADRTCVVCGTPFTPLTAQVRTCGRVCGCRARYVTESVPAPTCQRCGGPTTTGFGLCSGCNATHGSVQAQLRTLGVLKNKHIPVSYLRASEAQRRELLAGLLDTDGTVMSCGSVQFTSTSRRLADDVQELILSLGYRCGRFEKRVRGRSESSSTAVTLTFSTSDGVFRLERKRLALKERHRKSSPRASTRFITAVRRIESVPVRCVEVDNVDHLYLAGESMIPTHNSTLGMDFLRSASIANNQASVLFSLEMGKSEITMRLLSAEARIPLTRIRTGTLTDDDWTKLARRMGEVASAPMFIDDSPNLTMMEIRAKARRLSQREGLRLIVIDYLQLMSSTRRVENRQQEVAEMSRSLKLLAKELDVPVVAISQLNRGAEQRSDKKPQLSDLRECLTGDTLITRADTGEQVPIRDLAGKRDVPVWTLDQRLRLTSGVMSEVWSTGVKPVFRLTFASGREVKATANHPFLTIDGWKPVEQLNTGDHLAAARHLPEPAAPLSWPDHEIVMLAHLLGDGCVTRDPIYYCSRDEANLEVVEKAARDFGVGTRRTPGQGVTYLHFPMVGPSGRGHTNPIYDWLRDLGVMGRAAWEKTLPPDVHRLPNAQIKLFLRHLWATDGSVTTATNGRVRIYYGTTSETLARGVQSLLLRVGIGARLRRTTAPKTTGHHQGWTVDVSGPEDTLAFLTTVGVHGERGARCDEALVTLQGSHGNPNADVVPAAVWERIRPMIRAKGITTRALAARLGMSYCGSTLYKHGLSRARMARVADAVGDPQLADFATSNVRWDRIVSIEPAGHAEVFDAHVPTTHSFLANGTIGHNSGAIEQDADMVILLHREDAYERESPRAGEADLIVAKHRNGPTKEVVVSSQLHYSRFVDMPHA